MDMGVIERQFARWVQKLPSVRPFYAVKCNPDNAIIQQLASLDAGFDCASRAEIEAVLAHGVAPRDIIFANPIKTTTDLAFARSVGVTKMTFDNADELRKVKAHFPEAEMVLRLLPDDSGSLMRFGAKFGAPEDHVVDLLQLAKELDVKIIGTSFHIGSGCFDPAKYDSAVKLARSVFDRAESLGMPRLSLLDVGGGFPGNPEPYARGDDGTPPFEDFAEVISSAIAKYFPADEFPELETISEPGRYFATGCGTLFTRIQGKRENNANSDNNTILYYINDGVYGSFNNIMYDHAKPIPVPFEEFFLAKMDNRAVAPLVLGTQSLMAPAQSLMASSGGQLMMASNFSTASIRQTPSTIFGPTCDSMDMIIKDHPMRDLHVGEWLIFSNMGAYTTAAGTTFNGCPRPHIKYVRSVE